MAPHGERGRIFEQALPVAQCDGTPNTLWHTHLLVLCISDSRHPQDASMRFHPRLTPTDSCSKHYTVVPFNRNSTHGSCCSRGRTLAKSSGRWSHHHNLRSPSKGSCFPKLRGRDIRRMCHSKLERGMQHLLGGRRQPCRPRLLWLHR